jgi:hypothetical protein
LKEEVRTVLGEDESDGDGIRDKGFADAMQWLWLSLNDVHSSSLSNSSHFPFTSLPHLDLLPSSSPSSPHHPIIPSL